METSNGKLVLLTIGLLALATGVLAAPAQNAQFVYGANDSGNAAAAEFLNATGGNISNLTMSIDSFTNHWAGFFGTISTALTLQGAAGDQFYSWGTYTNVSGTVLLANTSTVTWSGIAAGTSTNAVSEDASVGFTASDEDNVSNTFTSTNAAVLNIGSVTITAHSAVSANTSSSGGNDWETILLIAAASDSVVYAGPINDENNNYAGNPSDFQLMVPVDATSGYRSYYTFAELTILG